MFATIQWTPQLVQQAVQAAASQRPVYAAMLPFFEMVFSLQEDFLKTVAPASLPLEALEGPGPLIDRARIGIDWEQALLLLEQLCGRARGANPLLAEAGRRTAAAAQTSRERLVEAAGHLLRQDMAAFTPLAEEISGHPEIFAFLLYNSLVPSIVSQARQIESRLDAQAWFKGACPICGGLPFISLLGEDGQRSLVCSFCRHGWPAKRIFCPFCESTDSAEVGYFYSEEEKEYRVHTCKRCGSYLKNVDTRELQRPCHPALENVLSAHLDLRAQQMGFQSRMPMWMTL